jgi:hypothetical protein
MEFIPDHCAIFMRLPCPPPSQNHIWQKNNILAIEENTVDAQYIKFDAHAPLHSLTPPILPGPNSDNESPPPNPQS